MAETGTKLTKEQIQSVKETKELSDSELLKSFDELFVSLAEVVEKQKISTDISLTPLDFKLAYSIMGEAVPKKKQEKQMSSYGYGVAVQPRTQKAKSVTALKKNGFNTPSFELFRIEQFIENPLDSKVKLESPMRLVNRFVRPCPMVPRHGFVDSRPIRTVAEAEAIINETLKVEKEAEFISMPFIDSAYSGIWTPGLLVIGPKNDGATAGKDSRAIPVIGIPHRYTDPLDNKTVWQRACNDAGITESPYVELLWQDQGESYGDAHGEDRYVRYFVQLRNGPSVPSATDFIPEEITVKQVIIADGDLLEWETKVKGFTKGTVVYHPGGSLASHYAVHAVLNNIPVLISKKPKVGDTLKVTAEKAEPNAKAIKNGFLLGCNVKIDYLSCVYAMLSGCHNTAVWLGKQDVLLGLAMGCAYRLTVTAALGEFRHAPGRYRKPCRETVYSRAWNRILHPGTRTRFVKAIDSFLNDSRWPSSFGGKKWGKFSSLAGEMYNAILEENPTKALEQFNQCVHAAHNGGWAFNKFVDEGRMHEAAANPLSVVLRCAPTLYSTIIAAEDEPKLHKWFDSKKRFELDLDEKAADKETKREIEEATNKNKVKTCCPECGVNLCPCGECAHVCDWKIEQRLVDLQNPASGKTIHVQATLDEVKEVIHIQYVKEKMPKGVDYLTTDWYSAYQNKPINFSDIKKWWETCPVAYKPTLPSLNKLSQNKAYAIMVKKEDKWVLGSPAVGKIFLTVKLDYGDK